MQSIKPRRQIARQTRPLHRGTFCRWAASKLCQPKFGRCIRMKKLLAAVLAAMFLFSTAALAETTANPQDRFLLICFEDAGTQTYALLGAGDGTQAFNAFAPESGTYETRFAGFWAGGFPTGTRPDARWQSDQPSLPPWRERQRPAREPGRNHHRRTQRHAGLPHRLGQHRLGSHLSRRRLRFARVDAGRRFRR